MAAAAAATPIPCEFEFQVADARTGLNKTTALYRQTVMIRRRGGLELAADDPPMRKALKMQAHPHEVYCSQVAKGKLTFIRRDSSLIYQYNLRRADPEDMQALLAFSLRMGAVLKTPRHRIAPAPRTAPAAQPLYQHQSSYEPMLSLKRSREALRDRTNEAAPEPRLHAAEKYPLSYAGPLTPSPAKRRRRRQSLTPIKRQSVQELTEQQRYVMRLIEEQQNVFFTGSAGTGKSFLLQHILKHTLQRSYASGRVCATATTGIAAYNIGGLTLHHFAGMDTRPYASKSELLARIQKKKDAVMRWKQVQVLIIDEVSMLEGALFDDLEAVARSLRKNQSFFGGIQLILSGDFFQLPPVSRQPSKLCFEAAAWRKGITNIVVLKQIFRQQNQSFVDILNAFRVGRPTDAMIAQLNQRYRPREMENDASAIHIFTHNDSVLETNTRRLEELGGKKFNYIASDSGKTEYLTASPAPVKLSLKKNAQVMLTKTLSATSGLVNGSRGVIEAFTPQSNLPIVRFSNGVTEIIQYEDFPVRIAESTLASRRQLPLTLAWAISIHKSQGLSFDAAVLDLSRVFEFGQAYVGLSRVRSLEGLWLRRPIKASASSTKMADARVLEFYRSVAGAL